MSDKKTEIITIAVIILFIIGGIILAVNNPKTKYQFIDWEKECLKEVCKHENVESFAYQIEKINVNEDSVNGSKAKYVYLIITYDEMHNAPDCIIKREWFCVVYYDEVYYLDCDLLKEEQII